MTKPALFPRLARVARDHPLVVFFALAYAFAWSFFMPMVAAGAIIVPLLVTATFGPTLAALLTHRMTRGSYRAFHVLASGPRMALGTIAGCTLVLVAFVVIPAVVAAEPRQLHWSVLVSLGVYDASTLLGGPLGEEAGWRGYALPRLEERLGPVAGTVLLSIFWTGWHLPLFLIPGWTSSPLWTYGLIQIGVSIILTFSVNLARFSVLVAIATHAIFNTVSRFLAGLFAGIQPQARISMVTLLALGGLGIALVLVIITKGRLAFGSTVPIRGGDS